MTTNIRKFSIRYLLAAIAVLMATSSAVADGDHKKQIKVKGYSEGMFIRDDHQAFSQGRNVNDVAISGSFSLIARHDFRSGRFLFPHLQVVNVEFPPGSNDPVFADGHVTGASVWIFDDDVICSGPTRGNFGDSGADLVSKAKLDCTDGTRMVLTIKDVKLKRGVSVETEIKGRWIFPGRDD